MTTPMQSMFPPKPKKIITPLTPQAEADAIRAKHAPKPEPEPEPVQDALEALEELAIEAQKRTTRTRK